MRILRWSKKPRKGGVVMGELEVKKGGCGKGSGKGSGKGAGKEEGKESGRGKGRGRGKGGEKREMVSRCARCGCMSYVYPSDQEGDLCIVCANEVGARVRVNDLWVSGKDLVSVLSMLRRSFCGYVH